MLIQPKIRGFICTTAHPDGCKENVRQQIELAKKHKISTNKPPRVLVIGASGGYGLASCVTAAFALNASTIGVFLEKPPTEKKTASAGWYNAGAFEHYTKLDNIYSKSINADAFADETKAAVAKLIKEDLGEIDLLIYSLASPVRKMPESGELVRSTLKPIGKTYRSKAIDTNKDSIIESEVEPANEDEIQNTIKVMGGDDWERWIHTLDQHGALSSGFKTIAYSYIGTEITWPIYWHGTIGRAKQDLERVAKQLDSLLEKKYQGSAVVAMLKSVVTQASSAIPMMPLYLSIVMKIMKQSGIHEDPIEQIIRLFETGLMGSGALIDDEQRIRLDDWELRDDIQQQCKLLWPQVTTENLFDLTDYQGYKEEFLRLFGFGIDAIDYTKDISPMINFTPMTL